MCGIFGIISKEVDKQLLISMGQTLSHRGPDAEGYYIERAGSKIIGLGHKRLSIIDLSPSANQPMKDGDVVIVFNGEIYNFPDLKKILLEKGYKFFSKSDTEVIIKSYMEWGIDFISKLNGMFAIGLLDKKKKTLYLIRDRIGIKPLYYYYKHGDFAFASELKAFYKIENFDKDIDLISLNDYFSLGYIPYPKTIFKNSYKLNPGSYLKYDLKSGELKKERYWEIDCLNGRKLNNIGEIKEKLMFLIEDSVRKRMISDVPLGAFLSGGIDSSIIVANMAKLSNKPVKTFTIGFEGEEDEREYARLTSKKYGTEHTEEILSFESIVNLIPNLIYQMDEPFFDHSIFPTYLVSKLARQEVIVALSGDGGDENFGGYVRPYMFSKYFEKYLLIPEFIRNIVEKKIVLPFINCLSFISPHKRKLFKIIEILSSKGDEQIISHMFLMTGKMKGLLYSDFFKSELEKKYSPSIFSGTLELNKGLSLPQWNMCHDLKNYMVNDILTKVDRMSMLNSLEVRVPFLDHRVVEFALRIPSNYKLRGKITKWILKETFKEDIPKRLINLSKKGFGIPLKKWVETFVKKEIWSYIKNNKLTFNFYFREREVLKLLENKKENFSIELWLIFVFLKWMENLLNK